MFFLRLAKAASSFWAVGYFAVHILVGCLLLLAVGKRVNLSRATEELGVQ